MIFTFEAVSCFPLQVGNFYPWLFG